MSGIIGDARDFYRLRVTRVDEGDEPDLEWREDILYRRPPSGRSAEYEVFQVQAVLLDGEDTVAVLGAFSTEEEAYARMRDVADDLGDMTKSAFEKAYFT